MNRLLWNILLWWLKAINSPWYMRKKAEDAMLTWGLLPKGANGWMFKSDAKQILCHIGSFVRSDEHGFRFYCRIHKIYGDRPSLYVPLKDTYLYTMEEIIEKFTIKTPQHEITGNSPT